VGSSAFGPSIVLRGALCAALAGGCVDSFNGSNIEIDFGPGMPVQASPGRTPMPGELAADTHFRLYAFESDPMAGRLFEIHRFEVHRIVDLASPCFIDVGAHVPHPGLHVSQYAKVIGEDTGIPDITNPPPGATEAQKIDAATAVQRQMNVAALASDAGIKVVSSASTSTYAAVAADCTDPNGIPPPMCTDAASNSRRLAMCQAAWRADPSYFEGTDRILTEPLNGTMYGTVVGMNPVNLAPVGGAQVFVDEVLDGFTGYAVYSQTDGAPDEDPGTLLLYGMPTQPARGVTHVHMTSTIVPSLTAEMAIFADLDDDEVQF
jgi:hypothetical protein